jgi:hypothetical protein
MDAKAHANADLTMLSVSDETDTTWMSFTVLLPATAGVTDRQLLLTN